MSSDLEELGEFGVIDLFRRETPARRPWQIQGIGDDCAIFEISDREFLLATTDMMLEGSHFERRTTTPYQLGWKALAVNVSDIAAMGGQPRSALLGLGLTPDVDREYLLGLREGMEACGRSFGVDISGGDTVACKGGIFISVTLLGLTTRNMTLSRSGAKPGDQVFLGRNVGDSAAGLRLLQLGGGLREEYAGLLRAHLEPVPQVDLGRDLAAAGLATAMIDVSDGVVQDLWRICRESGVGARIDADAVPISEDARRLGGILSLDPLEWALYGGEDYCLLFCGLADSAAEVIDHCRRELDQEVHLVGEITEGDKVVVRRGGVEIFPGRRGFDHFRPQ